MFNNGIAGTSYFLPMSETRLAISFLDATNLWNGTVVLCDLGLPVGIAKEPANGGETVPVIIHGISGVHSGLQLGKTYYAGSDGSLKKVPNLSRVGFAIGADKLLLDIER